MVREIHGCQVDDFQLHHDTAKVNNFRSIYVSNYQEYMESIKESEIIWSEIIWREKSGRASL